MAVAAENKSERRNKVFLGPLPDDFLRVSFSAQQQQEAADQQAALALQQKFCGSYLAPNAGCLSVTITQAKLVKNYGMTRMDPYVRVRVGHLVFETLTDSNGGKNPKWNKTIQVMLPRGVNSLYLEIFDECSFTNDELIAWAKITVPQTVFQGDTIDDWYPLSGKQGEGVEGEINLVLSYSTSPAQAGGYAFAPTPVLMMPPFARAINPRLPPVTVFTPKANSGSPNISPEHARPNREEELKQIYEMFPNVEKDFVKVLFDENGGDKARTINVLLEVQE